jgi:hypothetical protein
VRFPADPRHEALAALGPVDGPDVRGMPDGMLLHLRDTYPVETARSYHALEDAYRQRETVFAAVMTDRAEWKAATRQRRQLAVAADAELRRRHPGQYFTPLRSAEPGPATGTQRSELTLTAGEETPEMAGGSRTWPPEAGPSPTGSPTSRA